MSHNLLDWLANLSAIQVAVLARVAASFAGRGQLNANRIFDFIDHVAVLLSEFLNSNG